MRNSMWKRRWSWLCLAGLLAGLLAGCADGAQPEGSPAASGPAVTQPAETPPAETGLTLQADGCLSGLRWGMTVDEARAALAGHALTEGLGSGEDAETVVSLQFEAELFGQTAQIGLSFRHPVWVNPDWQGGHPLTEIAVCFPIGTMDRAGLTEAVTAVLGAQETRQFGYATETAEDGSVQESVHESELQDAGQYYWHAPQTLLDLYGEARLGELAAQTGNNDEGRTPLAMFYASWLYTARISAWDAAGGAVDYADEAALTEGWIDLRIDGSAQAAADAIAAMDAA